MSEHAPRSVAEAQELLARLSTQGRRIVLAGGGTVAQRPVELATASSAAGAGALEIVSTRALDRIVDHAPSDQVVVAEAGVTLDALQAALGKHGQRLSLDPPLPGRATLGGIVAANSFGPLRARFGSVRDLIIGVSIVRADGTLAKGGGKVVKTVAGFDLPKLMCGSMGTLGLIATVTFRVHPVPEAMVTLAARGVTSAAVLELVRAMRKAQLEPAAMLATRAGSGSNAEPEQRARGGGEGSSHAPAPAVRGDAEPGAARSETPGWDVAVRFEGFEAGVRQQAQTLAALARLAPLGPAEAAELWRAHLAQRTEGSVRFKVAALPTALPRLEAALAPLGCALSWYPTLGLGFASAQSGHGIAQARAALTAMGGSLVVEASPEPIEPWGPAPAALALHRSVKARFDPNGLLAPGTFVGGL